MKRRGKILTNHTKYLYSNETTEQVFNRFIDQKEAENLSVKSIMTYKLHIDIYFRMLDTDVKLPAWKTCTLQKYNEYIIYLKSLGTMKDVSIASYCRSLRAWFYWMMDNSCIDEFNVKVPRFQTTIPDTYSDDELSRLLEKPKKHCSYADYEAWVFINIAIATGLRLSSILSIKVEDVNFNDNIIYINRTKNKLGLKLMVNDELLKILFEYFKLLDLHEGEYIFQTAEGNQLAIRTMQDFIHRYSSKRGVKKAKAIHAFRHTFARNYYMETHDMYKLKEILGHSNISTTEQYLRSLGLATSSKIEYNPQSKLVSAQIKNKRGKRKM